MIAIAIWLDPKVTKRSSQCKGFFAARAFALRISQNHGLYNIAPLLSLAPRARQITLCPCRPQATIVLADPARSCCADGFCNHNKPCTNSGANCQLIKPTDSPNLARLCRAGKRANATRDFIRIVYHTRALTLFDLHKIPVHQGCLTTRKTTPIGYNRCF